MGRGRGSVPCEDRVSDRIIVCALRFEAGEVPGPPVVEGFCGPGGPLSGTIILWIAGSGSEAAIQVGAAYWELTPRSGRVSSSMSNPEMSKGKDTM